MTTFIEFHALRSFPPSNLNRDDLGSPKTAVFGGVRRLRISSQCLKRTWRMSEQFRGHFAENQLGIRTDRLPEEVLKLAGETLDDAARSGLLALLASIGKKAPKPNDAEDEPAEDESGSAGAASSGRATTEARTAHLLFLSRQEIEAVAEFAKDSRDALAKVFSKKKVDSKALEKLRDHLQDHLELRTSKNAVDVALFGRFVTSDEFDTVEGALQVAHGLGTQSVEVEYDYFTAVDDLGDTAGAGHLGESEFASSVLYLYACCDLEQLENNLGRRAGDGRRADAEARTLARKSLPALVRALAEATPKGKKTGTAPHTPAEYIEVVVRRGLPLSYANAFLKPVSDRGGDDSVMGASVKRLTSHRDRLEQAYGRGRDLFARFILSLHEYSTGDEVKSTPVRTIDHLGEKLGAALDAASRENGE